MRRKKRKGGAKGEGRLSQWGAEKKTRKEAHGGPPTGLNRLSQNGYGLSLPMLEVHSLSGSPTTSSHRASGQEPGEGAVAMRIAAAAAVSDMPGPGQPNIEGTLGLAEQDLILITDPRTLSEARMVPKSTPNCCGSTTGPAEDARHKPKNARETVTRARCLRRFDLHPKIRTVLWREHQPNPKTARGDCHKSTMFEAIRFALQIIRTVLWREHNGKLRHACCAGSAMSLQRTPA